MVELINRGSLTLDVLAQASIQECPQDGDSVLINGDYFVVSHREFELADGSLVLRRIYLFIPFAAEDTVYASGPGKGKGGNGYAAKS